MMVLESQRTRWFSAPVAVGLMMTAASAPACGTLEQWAQEYFDPGRSLNRAELFERMSECGYSYHGGETDRRLYPVLLHAVRTGAAPWSRMARVYHQYNCLFGARNEPDYADLRREFPSCRPKILHRINTPSGANLRAEPRTSAAIMTKMAHGALVGILEKKGAWVRVRTRPLIMDGHVAGGMTGYVHGSLVIGD